jgi:copper chaperone CopZ
MYVLDLCLLSLIVTSFHFQLFDVLDGVSWFRNLDVLLLKCTRMFILQMFSSKDDLDYPDQYLNHHRGFQSMNGHNTTLPIMELTVPMCCEKCQEKVKEALEEVEGVRNVICDQYNQRVTVTGFVDPLKVLRRAKRVKKKSAFFNNATYINASSLPSTNTMANNETTRYNANPLIRTNSSGFGRFPHEGHIPSMAMAPMVQSGMPLQRAFQQQPRNSLAFQQQLRNPLPNMNGHSTRYDNRQNNAFAPMDVQRDLYGIRRMPSFKQYRNHDAEYISMGNEAQRSMSQSNFQRPAPLRSQVSFSHLPVNNPYYMKHMESEYY